MTERHFQFIHEVVNPDNADRYGKSIKQMVNRYLADELRDDVYFDEEEAQKHLDFIGLMPLVDAEWAGKLMRDMMQPWQVFFFANIYGWKYRATGIRKYTDVYLQIPKKNSKTTMAAMIALDNAVNDAVQGGQIYFAGYSIDTADLCFKFSKRMLEAMMGLYPSVKDVVNLWSHSIEFKRMATFLKKVSSDAKNLEGKGARCAIIDEVHTHPNDMVIENMRSGMALYNDPLMVQITTPGHDKMEPCPAYPKYLHCRDVLAGIVENDRLFAMLWEPDDDDDWNDEKIWAKANPNIGISPKWDFLRSEYKNAKTQGGTKEVSFKIKHLGMWVDSDSVWLSDDIWMENQQTFPDDLPDVAYGGVDLSMTTDFSAVVWNHPQEVEVETINDEGIPITTIQTIKWIRWVYYMSEERLRNHKMEDIRQWARQGHIKVSPGRTIDYKMIKKDILDYADRYKIPIVFYDRYNANEIVSDLVDEGINMQPLAQTAHYLNVPTQELAKSVLEGRLQHGNNPVTRWQMKNVRILEDGNKNIKIGKKQSKGSVDGIVAAVMAIGAEMDGGDVSDIPGFAVINLKT